MTLNSLAFRLFATAALWTLLVLAIAGVVIDYVHKREAEAAFDTRLSQILASTYQTEAIPAATREISAIMREAHKLSPSGDVLLTLGAGDGNWVGQTVLKSLEERRAE